MNKLTKKYDAIVVGCGLAGLFCSLRLQNAGLNILLIDQRSVPGGLCGTKKIDGYEFVIACNDFGKGMEEDLQELDISFNFKRKKTRIYYNNKTYYLPPDWRTVLQLISNPWAFFKFVANLKNRSPECPEEHYIDPLVNRIVKERTTNDLLKLPAYMMGLPPHDFLLEAIDYDSSYHYGYLDPRTPDGGPQVLVDTLVNKFQEKGTLKLNTKCLNVKNEIHLKKVVTNQGDFYSSYVVSSQPRFDLYPKDSKQGMKLSMFCIAVAKNLQFPEDIHTMIYYPPGISDWYQQLDSGQTAQEFGFHIFKSDLPEKDDHYTMNIYFYLPRDMDEPPLAVLEQVETYIFEKVETLLPGLNQALKYKKFISPKQFTQLHGLSSRVTPVVMRAGFKKPGNYDPEQDIYYIGNSVYPPGDHAGASILSAKLVAEQVIEDFKKQLRTRAKMLDMETTLQTVE